MRIVICFGIQLCVSASVLLTGCQKAPAQSFEPAEGKAFEWKQPAIEVNTIHATEGTLERTVVLSGKVEPRQSTAMMAETAGVITKRYFEDGDVIKKGATLFRIDSSRQKLALESAEVALRAAVADHEWLTKDLARKEKLRKKGAVPSFEVDAAHHQVKRAEFGVEKARLGVNTAKRQLRDTEVKAPHRGFVHSRMCDVGDHVAPGRPLVELVDLSQIQVRIGVQGKESRFLKPGDGGSLRVPEAGVTELSATLIAVAPKSNPRTGLFDTTWRAENPEGHIRAGMIARVQVDGPATKSLKLILPRQSILKTDGASYVFLLKDNAAVRTPIETGAQNETHVEVLSGISPKDEVINSGLYSLSNGALVRKRVTQAMAKQDQHPERPAASPSASAPRK